MLSAATYDSRSDLYAGCIEAALIEGEALVPRLVSRVEKAIPAHAAAMRDAGEGKLLMDAGLLLTRHQDTLRKAYAEALQHEFSGELADKPRRAVVLNFDSLELMGDDQVNEAVELTCTQQIVLAAVETELARLNGLVSAAQGFSVVRASANPLRPEAWVRALRTAAFRCPVPPRVRVRWMQHLGEALGEELAAVYRRLSEMLRLQGVTAALFVVSVAGEHSGGSSTAAVRQGLPVCQPASEDVTVATADERDAGRPMVSPHHLLNVWDLRRLLLGEEAAGHARIGAPTTGGDPDELINTSITVPAAFGVLQEMKKVDYVVQRLEQGRPLGGHSAVKHIDVATRRPITPAQALSIEVVQLMVDNIAADARLLGPVRHLVQALEPALLRLALNDPRFFSDKMHPARQLLEQMTQRSLAWSSTDAAGFTGFFQPLRQAVDALVDIAVENADPFEIALGNLKQAWDDHEEAERRRRAKAARALLRAEQRNLLAEKIGQEVRARLDMAAATSEVMRFLVGPWSQVMAAARLADRTGGDDPGGYAAIINDLIWSSQARLAMRNPSRLARIVPSVLATLKRGLASIDYPAEESRLFLEYLAVNHASVLRRVDKGTSMQPSRVGQEPHTRASAETEPPAMWLAPDEVQASGLLSMDTQNAMPQRAAAIHLQGIEPAQRLARVKPGRTELALHSGAWVELRLDGIWTRCQLAWASPFATLLMFTDATGKAHSLTRPFLEGMLADRTLRVISDNTVVDGALDAVADAALRNSVDTGH